MTHPLASQVVITRAATAHATSSAFAALIWWAVPVVLVSVAIGYVVWTSKFQNETNRSVDKFNLFQQTLRGPDSEH